MSLRITHDPREVDWNEAARLISATLARRDPAPLRAAFERSPVTVFAWDGERLAGLGRALDDGVYQAVIYDLCLLPEYQGRGEGTRLLRALLARIRGGSVLLYAVPGKEGFYERFGFRTMTTAMARFADPERMLRLGYLRPAKD